MNSVKIISEKKVSLKQIMYFFAILLVLPKTLYFLTLKIRYIF